MIIRSMSPNTLLCINQSSHALMAAEFCRHWGNRDFRVPSPYAETMLAISQHDNGWYEWELAPKLRADGYPMDFLHDPDILGKLNLWRLGVNRAYAQHPYAAILIGQHAARLYQTTPIPSLSTEDEAHIAEFIADQQMLLNLVRDRMDIDQRIQDRLHYEAIAANMHLLQFGDEASLRIAMPWPDKGPIHNCPVDGERTYTDLLMSFDDNKITFSPWPFAVNDFEVHMHGRLIEQTSFADEESFHTALSEASFYSQTWRVVPA